MNIFDELDKTVDEFMEALEKLSKSLNKTLELIDEIKNKQSPLAK